jgi:nitric oxide reductase NorF protein
MVRKENTWLLGSAIWLVLIAIVSALIAGRWKAEALPFAAIGVILILLVVKSRIIVLDFIGLREVRPRMAVALVAWPSLFALLVAAKAAVQALTF